MSDQESNPDKDREEDAEMPDTLSDAAAEQRAPDRPRILSSDELFDGAKELWIEHGDSMYRLRITSSGKLYLTK